MRILLALLLGGCAHVLSCPAAGGPPWRELKSDHVELRTDLDEWAARTALDDLEVSAARLGGLIPIGAGPTVEVVLFRSASDYYELGAAKWSGGHTLVTQNGVPRVVMFSGGSYVDSAPRIRQTWQHEYTHALLHAHGHPPRWLDEGLAQLMESAEADEELRKLAIGRVMSLEPLLQWPSVAELVAADPRAFYREGNRARYYSAAWGLVYFVYRRHHDAFERMIRAVADGKEPWSASGLDSAAVNRELHDELSRDLPREWVLENPPWPRHEDPRAQRVLDDIDVHFTWLTLCDLTTADGRRAARAQLDQAALHSPGDARIAAVRAQLDALPRP